jgi:hypothetical protein
MDEEGGGGGMRRGKNDRHKRPWRLIMKGREGKESCVDDGACVMWLCGDKRELTDI